MCSAVTVAGGTVLHTWEARRKAIWKFSLHTQRKVTV